MGYINEFFGMLSEYESSIAAVTSVVAIVLAIVAVIQNSRNTKVLIKDQHHSRINAAVDRLANTALAVRIAGIHEIKLACKSKLYNRSSEKEFVVNTIKNHLKSLRFSTDSPNQKDSILELFECTDLLSIIFKRSTLQVIFKASFVSGISTGVILFTISNGLDWLTESGVIALSLLFSILRTSTPYFFLCFLIYYLANFDGARRDKTTKLAIGALDFVGCDLRKIRCNGIDFSESTLRNVNFSRADLRCSSFEDIDFATSDFYGAKLAFADFRGANLSRTRGLEKGQLRWVYYNSETQFPTGLSKSPRNSFSRKIVFAVREEILETMIRLGIGS